MPKDEKFPFINISGSGVIPGRTNELCENQEFLATIVQGQRPPLGFYRKRRNRTAVIRYLIEKVMGRCQQSRIMPLSVKDFQKHNLYGLLTTYYNCSPRRAILEAYAEELQQGFNPYENADHVLESFFNGTFPDAPRNFWTNPNNRLVTIRYFVEKILQKQSHEIYSIETSDFQTHHLGGFIAHYYNSSPIAALRFAYPEALPFLFSRIDPQAWQELEFRIAATKYFVNKLLGAEVPLELNPEIYKLTGQKLIKAGMRYALVKYHQGHIASLLLETFPTLDMQKFKYRKK